MDLTEIKHFEQQQDTTTLSACIRRGIKKRPVQSFHRMYISTYASCAMGAAVEGKYGEPGSICTDTFPLVPMSIIGAAIRWNDSAGMTREQIADRLEEMGY